MGTNDLKNYYFKINKIYGFDTIQIRFTVEEINVENTPAILELIMSVIEKKSVNNIIVDLSGVKLMYSCGFGMLYHIKNYLEKKGKGDLIIVKPSVNIMRTIEIIGLEKVIFVFKGLQEAKNFIKEKQKSHR